MRPDATSSAENLITSRASKKPFHLIVFNFVHFNGHCFCGIMKIDSGVDKSFSDGVQFSQKQDFSYIFAVKEMYHKASIKSLITEVCYVLIFLVLINIYLLKILKVLTKDKLSLRVGFFFFFKFCIATQNKCWQLILTV